jgi:hypothetical protein
MTSEQDEAILRRFEPRLYFTRGETFYPMDVEAYVRACSLWKQRPEEEPVCIAPQGEISLETLAGPWEDGFDTIYFLRFIEPLDILKLFSYLRQRRKQVDEKDKFHVGYGRLARVGVSSRVLDLIFSLSLLLRGRVPGDASAAAALEYEGILAQGESYSYHGRVIHQQGWVVLQYWLFYAFNNWRSGFFGVNDHESDWEVVNIYLYEDEEGELAPEWAAFSSHDLAGDDLRRRWDDPELEKSGDHVIVYIGAGSHANYFSAGEYQAEIEIPFLSPLVRLSGWVGTVWRRLTGNMNDNSESGASPFDIWRIPFVDYARGDGKTIGPGGEKAWDKPRLLEPTPLWASGYAGLWGLYAHDPILGENAPSGPMYNRDGGIRRSWCDPLGWAGLDKIPPPDQTLEYLHQERVALLEKQEGLEEEIDRLGDRLTRQATTLAAMRGHAQLRAVYEDEKRQMATLSEELGSLRAQYAINEKIFEVYGIYEAEFLAGKREAVNAHIQRPHHPATHDDLRQSRIVEVWAALSVGLMMVGFVGLILFLRSHVIAGLVGMISIFVFIESGFRRQLPQMINSLAIGLSVVSLLIILFDFFWSVVILAVLGAGVFILWENLRELWGR